MVTSFLSVRPSVVHILDMFLKIQIPVSLSKLCLKNRHLSSKSSFPILIWLDFDHDFFLPFPKAAEKKQQKITGWSWLFDMSNTYVVMIKPAFWPRIAITMERIH